MFTILKQESGVMGRPYVNLTVPSLQNFPTVWWLLQKETNRSSVGLGKK
jgi:hypothetical protein